MIDDLSHLIRKVRTSEALVEKVGHFYEERHSELSDEVCAYILDWVERKQDQIDYEWYLVGKMGDAIAAGRDPNQIEI